MAQILPPPPPQTDSSLSKWLYTLWQRVLEALTEVPTGNHPDLANLNSTNYYHLTQSQYTDLTDGGATTLHTHASGGVTSFNTRTGIVTLADTDISGASGVLTGDSRLSDARTPLSHTHGNITNAGAIGSTAGLEVVTTTSGVLTTRALGTANYVSGINAAGTALEWKSIAAGANVTVTHTAGTITVAATGGSGGTTYALTMNNGGSGDASGTTFDGSVARTLSYNTLGAAASSHTHGGGDITSAVATATTANGLNTSNNYQVNSLGVGAAASTTAGTITTGTVNGYVRVNNAFISCGGDYCMTGTHTWYNGSAWTNATSTAGAVLLITGQTFIFYKHDTGVVFTSNGSISATGDLIMTGNVTAYSDERLKTDWKELSTDFLEKLAAVKVGTYGRIDEPMRQVGVSAQAMQQVLPEAVLEGENGYLAVAYGNAALAACVELAKEVTLLRKRVEALESKSAAHEIS